jgi:hypothetical protein
MPVTPLGPKEWLFLITHVKQWVSNLRRAKRERKEASKEALRAVIVAVRATTVYLRSLGEGHRKSFEKEERLAREWTELAFKLEDIGLHKLAKRCSIRGMYWANPNEYTEEFLEKAGVRLDDIERAARASLLELKG